MDNLEIQVKQELGNITTNFEEVEKELKLQMSAYENFVVSEDEISIAKSDLAFLRKLRTSIEDKRKAIKKEYLIPYNKFEESCKKLTALIDTPIQTIDDQLKLFESDRIAKKRERITKLYIEQVGEYLRYLPVETNYNPKWDNKSTTDQDIRYDISALLVKVKSDLSVLSSLNSEIYDELLDVYEKSGNNLAKAVERNQQYISDKAKIEQQAKEAEKPVEEKPAEKNNLTSLNDFVQMTKNVRIIISADDLEQVKETLSFMGIKFTVEGE